MDLLFVNKVSVGLELRSALRFGDSQAPAQAADIAQHEAQALIKIDAKCGHEN